MNDSKSVFINFQILAARGRAVFILYLVIYAKSCLKFPGDCFFSRKPCGLLTEFAAQTRGYNFQETASLRESIKRA